MVKNRRLKFVDKTSHDQYVALVMFGITSYTKHKEVPFVQTVVIPRENYDKKDYLEGIVVSRWSEMPRRDLKGLPTAAEDPDRAGAAYWVFWNRMLQTHHKNAKSLLKQADEEVVAKGQFEEQESNLPAESVLKHVMEFVRRVSQQNLELLFREMKDKKYIRPLKKGRNKGKLTVDLKNVNRVLFDSDLLLKPFAVAAIIAKLAAESIKDMQTSSRGAVRFNIPISVMMDAEYWLRKVSEVLVESKLLKDEAERVQWKKQGSKNLDHYAEMLAKLVFTFNQKQRTGMTHTSV